MLSSTLLVAAAAATAATGPTLEAAPPVGPNPIYKGETLVKKINSTAGGSQAGAGELYRIHTEDNVNMWVLHTWGTTEQMAYTQGWLLAPILYEFMEVGLPQFYRSEAAQIPLGKLPKWLQKIAKDAAEDGAPAVFNALLGAVFDAEEKYIKASKSGAYAEFTAVAQGACDSGAYPGCTVKKATEAIKRMNMIPELVKMTCSMFGAWGEATQDGSLIQLRSLDFGDGPFANYTVLMARHPTDGGNDFVSVSFPGWSGAVTGFSSKVALSEKVWETYDNPDVQPGHYDGEPVALVIRDLIQFSESRADAIQFTSTIKRTWAVFLGVGDSATNQFSALGYREKDLEVFGPKNISSVTHAPEFSDVVYIDKHPQPSHDNVTMPGLMAQYHGHINASVAVQYIPRIMGSGDLHAAIYDFGTRTVYVATGLVTADGKYGADGIIGKACNQPYVSFDMDAMLNKKPDAIAAVVVSAEA